MQKAVRGKSGVRVVAGAKLGRSSALWLPHFHFGWTELHGHLPSPFQNAIVSSLSDCARKRRLHLLSR